MTKEKEKRKKLEALLIKYVPPWGLGTSIEFDSTSSVIMIQFSIDWRRILNTRWSYHTIVKNGFSCPQWWWRLKTYRSLVSIVSPRGRDVLRSNVMIDQTDLSVSRSLDFSRLLNFFCRWHCFFYICVFGKISTSLVIFSAYLYDWYFVNLDYSRFGLKVNYFIWNNLKNLRIIWKKKLYSYQSVIVFKIFLTDNLMFSKLLSPKLYLQNL